MDTTGHALKKTGGGNGWASGYAYTNYVLTGGCSLSFRPESTNTSFMIGLSSSTSRNNGARYYNIDYGFYPHSGAKYRIYEKGTRITEDLGSYSTSDLFTITYDNSHVHYYFNGTLKRSESVGSGKRFFVYLSIMM